MRPIMKVVTELGVASINRLIGQRGGSEIRNLNLEPALMKTLDIVLKMEYVLDDQDLDMLQNDRTMKSTYNTLVNKVLDQGTNHCMTLLYNVLYNDIKKYKDKNK